MEKNRKINTISMLLLLIAILMFYLGYVYGNWPPVITGVGFVVIVWGFQIMKEKK